MARIYRCTDRIPVRVDEITLFLSPLSLIQKTEIEIALKSSDMRDVTRGVGLAVKYALKDVHGLVDSSGQPYKLEFEGDVLSDACLDDLCNLEQNEKIAMICASLRGGVPADFVDQNGNKLEGVEIMPSETEIKNV